MGFRGTNIRVGVSLTSITIAAVKIDQAGMDIKIFQTEKLAPGKYQFGIQGFGIDVEITDVGDIYEVNVENVYDRSISPIQSGYSAVKLNYLSEYI